MNQSTRVAIGLGSNQGDRLGFLKVAYARLAEDLLSEPLISDVYETPPWGGIATGAFLNAVAIGNTDWKPPAIVNYLQTLQKELGRKPGPKWGDREIDLDLLAFGEIAWKGDGVEVPHPGLATRDFVLVPLVNVWPAWKHPLIGKTATELLAGLANGISAREFAEKSVFSS